MSAKFNGIKIDQVAYDVLIPFESLKRTAELIEGRASGLSIEYRKIRDLQGVGFTYQFQVEPNPTNRAAYDNFYNAITAAVDSHSITMPYGQTSITFDAYVDSVTDTFGGFENGQAVWKGLTVTFTYIKPVEVN